MPSATLAPTSSAPPTTKSSASSPREKFRRATRSNSNSISRPLQPPPQNESQLAFLHAANAAAVEGVVAAIGAQPNVA